MYNYAFSIFDSIFSSGSPVLFESEYVDVIIKDELRVRVPGLSSQDIKVELVKGRYLKITGENKETKSKVYKGFKLNSPVNPKDISAICRNGLLTIKFDLKEVKQDDVAEIPVIG